MPRILYVLETLNDQGEFLPSIGLESMVLLEQWMKINLSPAVISRTSNWRVVTYSPEDSSVIESLHLVH